MFIATQLAQVGAQSQSQKDFDAAYVRWEVESAVLGAELRAYYQVDSLHEAWARCVQLTTAYYAQSGIADSDQRKRYLHRVQQDVHLSANVDLANIEKLRAEVLGARDRVIREVLKDRMI